MLRTKVPTVIKQLGLTQTLATVADRRAAQLGLSTPEYIRHLIVEDNNPVSIWTTKPQLQEVPQKVIDRWEREVKEYDELHKQNPQPSFNTAGELIQNLEQ